MAVPLFSDSPEFQACAAEGHKLGDVEQFEGGGFSVHCRCRAAGGGGGGGYRVPTP